MLPGTERHPHAQAVLGAAVAPGGSPGHAYLLCGPPGCGKRTVARAFATALLTEGAADPAAAAARIEHGAHPDLTWVRPASAAGILVGDIDEAVVAGAARTPFEARRRVFVIEDADELNEHAANRMLKTLEEPPAFAHLLLLTARPGEVLPTIASRCQQVRFDAPPVEELAAGLRAQGVEAAPAEACARLALGDAARARALALGEGPALRAAAESVARGALRGAIADRPWSALLEPARAAGASAAERVEAALSEQLEHVVAKDRARLRREAGERARRAARRAQTAALDRGLALVGLWLRDVACVADGAPELAHNSDRLERLREDAELVAGGARPRAAQELVERTRASLQLHPNEELALDALGSRLARALAG